MERNINVSFIIPTYNEEKFLPKILSAIKQLVVNLAYEIIIVDNGSTDTTTQIAQGFGAKVITDPSKTIAGLRNMGASCAVGKVLIFLDGDVIITTEWAENILNTISLLQEHNNRIITGSRCGINKNPSWIERYWFLPMIQEKANYMNSGHLIINRDVFYEIGGFNDALITGEDWEFCMRAKQKGIMIINNPSLRVIHERYPKTLIQFIRKEKWHGIQDIYNIQSFFKSIPAMLASLYWVSAILGIALTVYNKSAVYIVMAVIINSLFCFLTAINKRRQFPLNIFFYFLFYNVYFFARGLSLLDRLFHKNMKIDKKIISH